MDFSTISNEQLRHLAMASTSLRSMDPAGAQDIVNRLSQAAPEQQVRCIAIFEQESANLNDLQKVEFNSLTDKIQKMDALLLEISSLNQECDRSLLVISESKSRSEDEAVQQQLLDQLSTI